MIRVRRDAWRGVTLYIKAGVHVIPNLVVGAGGDGGHVPSVAMAATSNKVGGHVPSDFSLSGAASCNLLLMSYVMCAVMHPLIQLGYVGDGDACMWMVMACMWVVVACMCVQSDGDACMWVVVMHVCGWGYVS